MMRQKLALAKAFRSIARHRPRNESVEPLPCALAIDRFLVPFGEPQPDELGVSLTHPSRQIEGEYRITRLSNRKCPVDPRVLGSRFGGQCIGKPNWKRIWTLP